jgi:hypothetical protein
MTQITNWTNMMKLHKVHKYQGPVFQILLVPDVGIAQ